MRQYLDLLQDIMQNGQDADNRTGIYARKVFGRQMRFDLSKGFPLVTTKKVYLRAIIHELIWLLSGNTNIKYLHDNNVTIWDEWSDANGDLGPVYGHQWRNFNSQGIDQIKDVIDRIKKNPQDRRLIVTAWNPAQICQMISKPDQLYLMPVPPILSSAPSRQERRGLRRPFGSVGKIPRFILKFPPFYCKINRICSKQHPAVWRGGAYSEHDSHSVGGPQKPGPSCGSAPR